MKRFIIFLLLFQFSQVTGQSYDFANFDFELADSIAAIYSGYDLSKEKQLVDLLTRNLASEPEKFRAIFKWITNNIAYDLELYHESKLKTAQLKFQKKKLDRWRKSFDKKMTKKLFRNKSSICSGYASLLESMCGFAGITCEVITGYGRTETEKIGNGGIDHAWNAVFLNQKWYLTDATWASGYVNDDQTIFRRNFNSYYFLAEPETFGLDHYPKNKKWLLVTNPSSLRDFLNSPHRLNGFGINRVNKFLPVEGRIKLKGDSVVDFSFTSNLPHDSIQSVTVHLYKLKKRTFEMLERKIHFTAMNKEGFHQFRVKLRERGEYLLRIFLRQRITFAYEVVVI